MYRDRNLMKLDYDNRRTRAQDDVEAEASENRTPIELFSDLFRQQNGAEMTDEQRALLERMMEAVWEETR